MAATRPAFAPAPVPAPASGHWLATAMLLLPLAGGASASTFGSLANFDVVNDTGHAAYGFEIEIEDSRFDHAGTLSSVFGYDRVFGFVSPDPGAVVRFGRPAIDYIAGFGVRINYGSVPGGALGGASTPSAPFITNGESCWPGANPGWKSSSCDHFGVSTYGSPAKTTYSWIVDMGGGSLAKQVVGVPAVNIVFIAPQPNLPPAPVMQLQAQDMARGADPVAQNRNNAFWVKIVKTTLEQNVDLNDLLAGNHEGARPEIAGLASETEIEWQPLQLGPNGVDEVSKSVDAPKPAVVYQFQFFNYQGRYDDDGYVDPQSGRDGSENQMPFVDAGVAYVNLGGVRQRLNFVGQQIAGFNANEVAAVPEPQSWALLLAGLGLLGWRRAKGRSTQA